MSDAAPDTPLLELSPEQAAAIEQLPCEMFSQEPYDFAWCDTHDTTFPLGTVCRHHKREPAAPGQPSD